LVRTQCHNPPARFGAGRAAIGVKVYGEVMESFMPG
jgi:hypothetical protein